MTKSPSVEEPVLVPRREFQGGLDFPFLPILIGVLSGAVIYGIMFWAASGRPDAALPTAVHAKDSDLKVRYTVQESPNTTVSATMENVTDIEFQPSYIIVKEKNGYTRVFFNHNTQSLTWSE